MAFLVEASEVAMHDAMREYFQRGIQSIVVKPDDDPTDYLYYYCGLMGEVFDSPSGVITMTVSEFNRSMIDWHRYFFVMTANGSIVISYDPYSHHATAYQRADATHRWDYNGGFFTLKDLCDHEIADRAVDDFDDSELRKFLDSFGAQDKESDST